MGICEVLTIIFVICKILGIGAIAGWSWFLVLLPEIIAFVFYVAIIALWIFTDIFTKNK